MINTQTHAKQMNTLAAGSGFIDVANELENSKPAEDEKRSTGITVHAVFVSSLLLLVYAGWGTREEWPFTAESGVGYMLGIIGAVMMLLLLLYPLRKHNRKMRGLGSVKSWFKLHMVLGVLGPVLIIFHSGFNLGSLNSSIALACMAIVALSGLVGRYFYIKIHYGLYGRKATQVELQQHTEVLLASLIEHNEISPQLLEQFKYVESYITPRKGGLLKSIWLLLSVNFRTRVLYLRSLFATNSLHPVTEKPLIKKHIHAHLSSVRKTATFHFYERLFSIWHIVHMPLFLMLILTGTAHVISVHLF